MGEHEVPCWPIHPTSPSSESNVGPVSASIAFVVSILPTYFMRRMMSDASDLHSVHGFTTLGGRPTSHGRSPELRPTSTHSTSGCRRASLLSRMGGSLSPPTLPQSLGGSGMLLPILR